MNVSAEACRVYEELYPDPSSTLPAKAVFGLVYTAIFLLGLLGNSAVILITLQQKNLQTVQNLFILNLSVADLVVCLLSVPITPITNIYKQWFFGRVMCHLIPWSQGTSIFVQSFSLSAVALNRYTLILHPHVAPMSRTTSLGIILLIWTTSMALTIPYGYYMKVMEFRELCGWFCDEAWDSASLRGGYTLGVFAAQFLLPALLISACYGAILRRLRERTNERLISITRNEAATDHCSAALPNGTASTADADDSSQHWGEEQRVYNAAQIAKLRRRKRRTTLILACMVLIFVLAWFPYQVINIIIEFSDGVFLLPNRVDLIFVVVTISHAFAMTSVLANPFIYAWLNLSFRQTIALRMAKKTGKGGSAKETGEWARRVKVPYIPSVPAD